jgi:hypothetical protein
MQTKGSLLNSFQMRLLVFSFRYLTYPNVNTYHSQSTAKWLLNNFSFVIQNVFTSCYPASAVCNECLFILLTSWPLRITYHGHRDVETTRDVKNINIKRRGHEQN